MTRFVTNVHNVAMALSAEFKLTQKKVYAALNHFIKEGKLDVIQVEGRVFLHPERFFLNEQLEELKDEIIEYAEGIEIKKSTNKKTIKLTNLVSGEEKTFESQRAAVLFLGLSERRGLVDGQIVNKTWKVTKTETTDDKMTDEVETEEKTFDDFVKRAKDNGGALDLFDNEDWKKWIAKIYSAERNKTREVIN